ncbi:MAG TPA: hypothetical protein VFT45_09700, partial [Longimicrobium sp.]|nr:hypothetical protein [Longimicrobium sp.]
MLDRLILPLAGAALLASAVPAVAQVNLAAARASLRGADHEVSAVAETRGILGLVPYLADSADVLLPGLPLLRGRDVAAEWLDMPPFAEMRLMLEPVRIDVSADGRSGYTYGGATRITDDGPAPARYIAFWNWDGADWKIAAFHFNAAQQPVTPPPAGFFPEPAATGPASSGTDAAAALEQIMQADRD